MFGKAVELQILQPGSLFNCAHTNIVFSMTISPHFRRHFQASISLNLCCSALGTEVKFKHP